MSMLVFAAPAAFGQAADEGDHSENMDHVGTLPYELRNGGKTPHGTDIEFTRIGGRQYALAGSYWNGMQIVDITNPRRSRIVSVYDCGVTQGDVQVFRQADKPGRTFVAYASDTQGDGTSTCYQEAAALGFEVKKSNGTGRNGTFIAEITNPLAPTTVSFVDITQGAHNQTVHPSGNFLYNSNSDLITSYQPAIEIFDISNFAAPTKVSELALPTPAGPRHGVARHQLLQRRHARVLGGPLAGRRDRLDQPRQPERHLELDGPGDQRVAPARAVHDA